MLGLRYPLCLPWKLPFNGLACSPMPQQGFLLWERGLPALSLEGESQLWDLCAPQWQRGDFGKFSPWFGWDVVSFQRWPLGEVTQEGVCVREHWLARLDSVTTLAPNSNDVWTHFYKVKLFKFSDWYGGQDPGQCDGLRIKGTRGQSSGSHWLLGVRVTPSLTLWLHMPWSASQPTKPVGQER